MQVLLATLNGKMHGKFYPNKKYSTKIIFDHLIIDSLDPRNPNHASPACCLIAKTTFNVQAVLRVRIRDPVPF
jgi:hypothetical protein